MLYLYTCIVYEAEKAAALMKVVMCTSGLAVVMVSSTRTTISSCLKERSMNMNKKMHGKLEMLRKHFIRKGCGYCSTPH